MELKWVGEGANEKAYFDGMVIVEIDERYYRPAEVDLLLGDYTKAKTNLGWEPKTKFNELVKIMMKHDIKNEQTP
jgi:GDPmannose 4,6-dehydratase